MKKSIWTSLLVAATLVGSALQAQAQEYPTKLVRIIVPTTAGSSTDALARLISEKLQTKWGQPVRVENRPGASNTVGAEQVFRSPPDGYTLLFMAGPFLQKALFPKLAFDPDELMPLSVAATVYSVLVVNPGLSVQTLPELIAFAKANPDKLNYASTGKGSPAHLTAELLKSVAGIKMVQVPFQGNAPAMTALLGGHVNLMFVNLGQALPHIRSGKLRALAVASDKRNALLPNVPTTTETLPDFVSQSWFGLLAPPNTPSAIANKISADTHEALRTPEIERWLATNTFEAVGGTPTETAQFYRRHVNRWTKVIKEAGITGD